MYLPTLSKVALDNELVLLCVATADNQIIFAADEPAKALIPCHLAHHLDGAMQSSAEQSSADQSSAEQSSAEKPSGPV